MNIMVKKNHSKNRQNLVKITCEGEAKFICEVNVENLKRKKSNKPLPPKHPRKRKKLIEKKMLKKNPKSNFSGTFDCNPEEYSVNDYCLTLKNK